MKPAFKKIPKRYHPNGFEIVHEDWDIIVGNKSPGILTVEAKWEKVHTVENALNEYVRKGNPKSRKCVYVVHRLDQATSGILVFAKSEDAQLFLKDNWPSTEKTYYAIVHGKLAKPSGKVSSYLQEDEEYFMHSSAENDKGKLAHTEYQVLKETAQFSLVKINLLTGRKNQIRVHLAELGNPVVGDDKYGVHSPARVKPGAKAPGPGLNPAKYNKKYTKFRDLALHSAAITITHPFSKARMSFAAKVPEYFNKLVEYNY